MKIKSEKLPYGFHNFSVKYEKGVNLVIGVRLEIFLKKPLGGKHLSFSL